LTTIRPTHRQRAALLAALLWAASQLVGVPAGHAAAAQVVADNSRGNGASLGEVLDDQPQHSKLALTNLHDFWTNIAMAPATGTVKLTPANPFHGGADIGGLYAAWGAIGPDEQAVWSGSFATPTASQLVRTTPSIEGGSALAGTLNLLTIFAGMFDAVPNVAGAAAVFKAAELAQAAPDFAAAVRDLQSPPPLSLATHIYRLLKDPQQEALLREALAQLGVAVTTDALSRLLTLGRIYDLSVMAYDRASAIILQNSAGQVLFYRSGPPDAGKPTPTPSASSTTTSTAPSPGTSGGSGSTATTHTTTTQPPPTTKVATIPVPANDVWVNTGFTVTAGQRLSVTATGTWSPDPVTGSVGPDGAAKAWPDNFLNLQDIGVCATCATTLTPPWAALIGYIGSAPPAAGSYTSTSVLPEARKVFPIGGTFRGTAALTGQLWLNFNDDAYSANASDNSGQVTAAVTAG